MYRSEPSDPIRDSKSSTEFVALPWVHFKESQDFILTQGKRQVRLSTTKLSSNQTGVTVDNDARVFGDASTVDENTPIFYVNDLTVSDLSGSTIEHTGPERRKVWDDLMPVFGRMLLRWLNDPAVYVSSSFREDFFKTLSELSLEALDAHISGAHLYIRLSQTLMARYSALSVPDLRSKLGLDPIPGETEDDAIDRVEASLASFAGDNYMMWTFWAESSVEGLVEDVAACLDPQAQMGNLKALLFAEWLVPGATVPDEETYVETRLAVLKPGLKT